jgi:hypothetical protein
MKTINSIKPEVYKNNLKTVTKWQRMMCCEQDPKYLFMTYLMILSVARAINYQMV